MIFRLLFLLLAFTLGAPAQAQTIGAARVSLFGPVIPSPPVKIYENSFIDICQPLNWSFIRGSLGWDWSVSHALTQYAINTPICPGYYNAGSTNYGLGIWTTRLNRLPNSTAPVTNDTNTPTGTHSMWAEGTGSLTVSGGSVSCTPSCTATSGNPVTVQNPAGTTSLHYAVSGSLTFFQLETCSSALIALCSPTAPILTSGSSFPTRQPDRMNILLTDAGYDNGYDGTAFVTINQANFQDRNNTILYLSGPSGTANGISVFVRASDHRLQASCLTNGVASIFALAGPISANTPTMVGISWSVAQGFSIAFNGQASASVKGACPHVLTQLTLGGDALGAFQLNGYIQKLTLYNGRFDAATLQSMTAPLDPSLDGDFFLTWWYGQSNSVGRKSYPALTTTPPYCPQLQMFNDRWQASGPRLFYNYLAFSNPGITGLVCAFETNGQVPPFNIEDWGEVGIVADGAQTIFMGNPNQQIVRSGGAGSTTIAILSPSSPAPPYYAYNNFLTQTTAIYNLIHGAGGTLNIPAVKMVLGESDRSAGTTRAAYVSGNITLSNAFASDMKGITTQSNNPMWYQAQLSQGAGHGGDGSEITLAQADLMANPLWTICQTRYQYLQVGDGLHQGNLADRTMGEQFGYCQETARVSGQKWDPVRIATAAFSNLSTINLTVHTLTGEFVFDDGSNIPQGVALNGGLQFADDCTRASPTAPYTFIAGVTKTDVQAIQATLTTPYNPACANPTIYNAYNSPSVASQTSLPSVGAPGTSGIPGPCVLMTSFNESTAGAQARYNATIASDGTLGSIDSLDYWGVYQLQDAGSHSAVPVSGCGLLGATIDSFSLSRSFTASLMTSAWGTIRDISIPTSRLGTPLPQWAISNDTAVTGP